MTRQDESLLELPVNLKLYVPTARSDRRTHRRRRLYQVGRWRDRPWSRTPFCHDLQHYKNVQNTRVQNENDARR